MSNLMLSIIVFTIVLIYIAKKLLQENVFHPWYTRFLNLPSPNYPITGKCEEEFEEVKQLFQEQFERGIEVGASVAVYSKEDLVVELYGGYKDFEKNLPYDASTLNVVFSCSKFMSSVIIAKFVDEGLLDYNEKVCKYWPEYANGNKQDVTLADLLRHEGGVTFLDKPIPTYEEVNDFSKLREIISNHPHVFDGKKVRAYHALTRGLVLNEIVKSVDKEGRSIGQIYEQEINALCDIEFYLGLNSSNMHRKAIWYNYPILDILTLLLPKWMIGKKAVEVDFGVMKSDSYLRKGLELKISTTSDFGNSEEFHNNEYPSANGYTNAKSLARIGTFFANEGKIKDAKLISPKGINKSLSEMTNKYDHCLLKYTDMSLGGIGQFKIKQLGLEYSDIPFYGWCGFGGSCILFQPDYNFSFSYVMNARHLVMLGEGRATNLLVVAFKAHMRKYYEYK